MGGKNRLMEHDGWLAKHRKHDDNTEGRGGGGGMQVGLGLWSLQGRRKCLLYEQLVKVLISGVFPRATSLYVAATLKLLIINGPKGPKLILYSHKALMQGKVGANGTLGKQTSRGGGAGAARCRCSDRRDRDRGRTHTETQGGGQRVRTKMKKKKKSHCEL